MDIYGIPNCSTVKKARTWLEQHGIAYQFHDFKKTGVSVAQLDAWAQQTGWEKLLNRQGMTWRQLSDDAKAGITGADTAFALMTEKTSVIKRPVLVHQGQVLVGFNEAEYTAALT
ncbi:MAG: ArsC family reductase [Sulfuriferula sp.]|nr:ArsC family reductase [Sulfuriferula sp.]